MSELPTTEQLSAVAAFADVFDAPGFSAGEWVQPQPDENGVVQIGWWVSSQQVTAWHQALYDNRIIDGQSNYLSSETTARVRALMEQPALVNGLALDEVRTVLTFLARAERHSDGGWFEQAFDAGLTQAATGRLGELVHSVEREMP